MLNDLFYMNYFSVAESLVKQHVANSIIEHTIDELQYTMTNPNVLVLELHSMKHFFAKVLSSNRIF